MLSNRKLEFYLPQERQLHFRRSKSPTKYAESKSHTSHL